MTWDASWPVGTVVQWVYRREDWQPGQAQNTCPVRVVRHDHELLALWLAADTVIVQSRPPDGSAPPRGPAVDFTGPRVSARTRWHGPGILVLSRPADPWTVWLFWREDGSFEGWYVNLESPRTVTDDSVTSQDHVLDLDVGPDRGVRRKDEDELVAAVEQGRFTAEQAAQVTRDAEAAEAVVAAWGSPFCDGWEHWRPDPDWPVPELPADVTWDVDLL